MSIFNDKIIKSVAEAAAKIMTQESIHGTEPKTDKEKKLAAMAHPKDKITHKDVLVGRGVLNKEATDEGASKKKEEKFHMSLDKLVHKTFGHSPAEKKMREEVELTESHFKVGDDVVVKDGGMEGEVVKVDPEGKGKYYTVKLENGKTVKCAPEDLKLEEEEDEEEMKEAVSYSAKSARAGKDIGKPGKMFSKIAAAAGKRYGSEERGRKVAGAILAKLRKEDIEDLSEEPDNAQWTKELKDQEATAAGKKKPAKVASPATQGVKIMPEETEQLDELKKSTLASYANKAIDDVARRGLRIASTSPRAAVQPEVSKRLVKASQKNVQRRAGIKTAISKLAKEETEQLDELKKTTLLSYVNKAAHKIGQHAYDGGAAATRGDLARSDYHQKKEAKRTLGVIRASGRLATGRTTKEEVEQIDEEKSPYIAVHAKKGKHETHGSSSYEAAQNAAKHWGMKNTAGIDVYRADKTHSTQHVGEEVELDERELSEPEMKKKEEYVKGMKKKLSGFKQRYGERAKSVIYATATKMAKED